MQAVQDFTAIVPDLMVSTVPLAVTVIFGTQRVSCSPMNCSCMRVLIVNACTGLTLFVEVTTHHKPRYYGETVDGLVTSCIVP